MTSGTFGNSTAIDHSASKTFLDIGGECEEITDEPWILIFPNEDNRKFSLYGYNLYLQDTVSELSPSMRFMKEARSEFLINSTIKFIAPSGETDAGKMYLYLHPLTIWKKGITN